MQFELTEEQRAFVDMAGKFAEAHFAPQAARWDLEQIFPREALLEAGKSGLLSLYTPTQVGGMGLSRLDASLIFEELAAGCTSTTAFMTIHNMALWMITAFGNAETQAKFIPPLLTGEHLVSYCLTEPGAGSDAATLQTTAVVDGDYYRLSGSKAFISGAGDTEVLVVMARLVNDEGTKPGAGGISSFVVPADASGISYGNKEQKMGWNSQPTRQIYFDEVQVPASYRLGAEGQGFKIAMRGLDGGRINIAACSIGTARAALDRSLAYVQERQQFGQPLAQLQSVQFKIADMTTKLVAARQLMHLAAFKLDQQHPSTTVFCAMAKRFATDISFEICNEALQIHGGYGYLKEFPLERHVRDVRVHQILEGTNEVMQVIISRAALMAQTTEVFR